MTQRCGVCASPKRAEIDAALMNPRRTRSLQQLADLAGVQRLALYRHRDNHVVMPKAAPKSPRQGDDSEDVLVVEDAPPPPPPQDLPGQQTAFLTAYAASCDVKQGLKAAGITRTQLRKWQEHDDAFLAQFHQAEVDAIESLEYEARLRAVAGSKLVRRVFRHGLLYEEIHEWRPSDAMMVKLLQAARPEKYGERLTVTQTTVVKAVDAEAWAQV